MGYCDQHHNALANGHVATDNDPNINALADRYANTMDPNVDAVANEYADGDSDVNTMANSAGRTAYQQMLMSGRFVQL